LISDIDMPVMDGFELLRVAHAARPELPVILITGHPEMLNRLPAIGPGHYRSFKKPFDGQELLTAVSDALRKPHLRTP
jgi:DNA-binding NtrC family response regulator